MLSAAEFLDRSLQRHTWEVEKPSLRTQKESQLLTIT